MLPRWEKRADNRGRPYYVDHNTRTTTWQRPNPDLMNHLQQFQQWRQNRQIDQLADRFMVLPLNNAPTDELGPLPEGWGAYCYTPSVYIYIY